MPEHIKIVYNQSRHKQIRATNEHAVGLRLVLHIQTHKYLL